MLFSTNVSGIIQEKTQVYCGRGTTKKQVVDYGTEITSKSLKGALFPLLSCSQCANVRRMKPAQGAEHFFFFPSNLTSPYQVGHFYPQRSPREAVVTGVFPSAPLCAPSFLSRIGLSIPTARRSISNVADSRSRAFRLNAYVPEVKCSIRTRCQFETSRKQRTRQNAQQSVQGCPVEIPQMKLYRFQQRAEPRAVRGKAVSRY